MIGSLHKIDTNAQSQQSPLMQYYLIQELKTDCALSSPVSEGDTVINLAAGHGFTGGTGEMLVMWHNDFCEQFRVKSVATNAVTVEMPSQKIYPVSGTVIVRGNKNMNVDGSSVPKEFKFYPRGSTPQDVSKIVGIAWSGASVPDDGTFLGLAALTSGMYMKFTGDTGSMPMGNYETNSDFKAVGASVVYDAKAPSGTNGTTISFPIGEIFGTDQVIRVDPRVNQAIVAVVRANLSALARFDMSMIGSYTSGE